jgi:colicin import membrane protein
LDPQDQPPGRGEGADRGKTRRPAPAGCPRRAEKGRTAQTRGRAQGRRGKEKGRSRAQGRRGKEKGRSAEEKKKAEAERKAAEEKKKAEAERKAAEEKKKAEAERKRKAEAEAEAKRKAEAEARRKAEAEKRREAELALQQQLAAEQAERDQGVVAEYTAYIQEKIQKNWLKPAGSPEGLSCTVQVSLIPGGDVARVQIVRSSGDPLFDRSVETAVHKASPMPLPKDAAMFKYFRELRLIFKPR